MATFRAPETMAQIRHPGGDHVLPGFVADLVRYYDDSVSEIDNTAAERALRGVAIDRRNYLFAGADIGGERALRSIR
jgi:hypothetical protein